MGQRNSTDRPDSAGKEAEAGCRGGGKDCKAARQAPEGKGACCGLPASVPASCPAWAAASCHLLVKGIILLVCLRLGLACTQVVQGVASVGFSCSQCVLQQAACVRAGEEAGKGRASGRGGGRAARRGRARQRELRQRRRPRRRAAGLSLTAWGTQPSCCMKWEGKVRSCDGEGGPDPGPGHRAFEPWEVVRA